MKETNQVLDTVMSISRTMKRRRGRGHHRPRGGFRILRVLESEGPMVSKDLAEKLDIRPSSLSEALDRLQEKGLIERTPDQDDKRKVTISTTDKVKEMKFKRQEKQDEYQTIITNALTKEEQDEFIRLGNKIVEALRNASSER